MQVCTPQVMAQAVIELATEVNEAAALDQPHQPTYHSARRSNVPLKLLFPTHFCAEFVSQ